MRTLFICYSYLAGNGGGIYAARTHINLFAELSSQMTLLYPYKKGMEPEGISIEKINAIPIKDTRSRFSKLLDIYKGKMHRYINIDKKYFDSSLYDIVVFDNSIVSSKLIKKFKNCNLKVITIHHNYQIEYLLGDCPLPIILPSLFWTWIYEKEAVNLSDINITLTEQDAKLLANHYNKNANIKVLGVYEYQRKSKIDFNNKTHGNIYIITGGLSSKQTEKSLIPWIKEYYPLLKKCDPKAELIIAGKDPSKKLQNIITKAGINLYISPPNMISILQKADYYICPTDCGGGLKLRIMDGLKVGLPIITHFISARGYEKMLEEGIVFSYKDKESFIECINKVTDINMSKKIIQEQYYKFYKFEAGIQKLKNILEK